jgi:hypothetical protein
MADAKCALKHLFELTSEMKRDACNKESKYEDLICTHWEVPSKLAQCEQQLREDN